MSAPQPDPTPPSKVVPEVAPVVVPEQVPVQARAPEPVHAEAFPATADNEAFAQPETMTEPLLNKEEPASTTDDYMYGQPPIMKMQTQLINKPLASQVAGAPDLPIPADTTPFYKKKKGIAIIVVVVVILLIGGIVGLILALMGGSSACISAGQNLCSCDGVFFPLLIDGDSVVFGNLTFSESEVTRLKSVNGNNTISTYSIFEQIDSATLKCETTLGQSMITYNETEKYPWDGQLKDGKPFGYGTFKNPDPNPSPSDPHDATTLMLDDKATGLLAATAPIPNQGNAFFVTEARNWQPNGLGTIYSVENRSIIINVKGHDGDVYD